jgi:hypothetical protein
MHRGSRSDFKRDRSGNIVLTKLDENLTAGDRIDR